MGATVARQHPSSWAGRRALPVRRLLAVVVTGGVSIALVAALLRSPAPAPPAAPLALTQETASRALPAGSVINLRSLDISFRATTGTSAAIPEIEIVPAGRPFTGRVSARGTAIAAEHRTIAHIHVTGLRNGVAYRWRARLYGKDGRASSWMVFNPRSRQAAFAVDLTPPPPPELSSPTDPDQTAWYFSPLATIAWTPPHDPSGIQGYAAALDGNSTGAPQPRVTLTQPELQVRVAGEGQWYLHVRAVDGAGNWSATATYALHIDLHPAQFVAVHFPHTTFDPDIEPLAIDTTLAAPVKLHMRVTNQFDGTLIRSLDITRSAGNTTVLWDGRTNSGEIAPDGSYRIVLAATDHFGQQAVADYSDLILLRRRVVISLRQQRMVAYEGTQPVLTTLVTTGNKALPTPVGIFHILVKRHPFTFISPWPASSPYYYPPSPVNYALLFDWRGYFIHDAPWRSRFGPGSNAKLGRPGQDLTGTHGCVNTPPDIATWLYNWLPVGAAVQVVP